MEYYHAYTESESEGQSQHEKNTYTDSSLNLKFDYSNEKKRVTDRADDFVRRLDDILPDLPTKSSHTTSSNEKDRVIPGDKIQRDIKKSKRGEETTHDPHFIPKRDSTRKNLKRRSKGFATAKARSFKPESYQIEDRAEEFSRSYGTKMLDTLYPLSWKKPNPAEFIDYIEYWKNLNSSQQIVNEDPMIKFINQVGAITSTPPSRFIESTPVFQFQKESTTAEEARRKLDGVFRSPPPPSNNTPQNSKGEPVQSFTPMVDHESLNRDQLIALDKWVNQPYISGNVRLKPEFSGMLEVCADIIRSRIASLNRVTLSALIASAASSSKFAQIVGRHMLQSSYVKGGRGMFQNTIFFSLVGIENVLSEMSLMKYDDITNEVIYSAQKNQYDYHFGSFKTT